MFVLMVFPGFCGFIFFFFNDTATTEIYTLSPTRRSSDLSAIARTWLVRLAASRLTFAVRSFHVPAAPGTCADRKSTRLNSSHLVISYAVFCLKKKKPQCGSTLTRLHVRCATISLFRSSVD